MLPWIDLSPIDAGSLRIQPFLGFLLGAVLAGRWAFVKAAVKRGFEADIARAFYSIVIVVAALAGPVWAFAREPGLFRSDPRIWPGFIMSSSWAGIAAGIGAALVLVRYARLNRTQAWLLCDSFAWAFPFGWAVLRLGCAWTHHHPGIASSSFLAVRYPGRARFDLALLEALLCLALVLLWVAARRRSLGEGLVSGIVLLAVGAFRYAAGGLRLDRQAIDGWDLMAPAALLALGAASTAYGIWGRRIRERQSRLEGAIA